MKYFAHLPLKICLEKELEPLMADFYKGRSDDVTALKSALENDDWKEIKRRGHILSGVCGTYGLDDLGKLGHHLEDLADSKTKNEIYLIVETIESYMSKVRFVYK